MLSVLSSSRRWSRWKSEIWIWNDSSEYYLVIAIFRKIETNKIYKHWGRNMSFFDFWIKLLLTIGQLTVYLKFIGIITVFYFFDQLGLIPISIACCIIFYNLRSIPSICLVNVDRFRSDIIFFLCFCINSRVVYSRLSGNFRANCFRLYNSLVKRFY